MIVTNNHNVLLGMFTAPASRQTGKEKKRVRREEAAPRAEIIFEVDKCFRKIQMEG